MVKEYLQKLREPGQTVNPLFTFLGLEVIEIEPERAVLRLPGQPGFVQGAGATAGGILSTLLDEAMAHAVLGGNPEGKRVVTVDMNVRFLRGVPAEADLLCEAKVVKRGSRVVFTEGVITHNGDEAARASASFMIV